MSQHLLQQPARQQNCSSMLRVISLGLGVIGIGFLIGIGGYLLGANKSQTKSEVSSKSNSKQSTSQYTQIPLPTSSSLGENDLTVSWKTHNAVGYLIKYPSDFKVIPSVNSTSIKNNTGDFDLNIASEGTSLSLGNYVDQDSWCTYINSKNGEAYSIDNEKALRFEEIQCGQVGSTDIYTIHNGVAYHLNIPTQSSYKNYLSTLNMILSTFKFTDQNQNGSGLYCLPSQLLALASPQDASGTMYVDLTVKNISNSTCQIVGNNFVNINFDSVTQNITINHPKQPTVAIFTLVPNQTLYSLIAYSNGPQCQNAPTERTITLSYIISPANSVSFTISNSPLQVPDCVTNPGLKNEIEVQSLSDSPIKL